MAYASVGEITADSVMFRQAVHTSGARMSIPKFIAKFLDKEHDSELKIEIKRGGGWITKTVTLESGLEILAGRDAKLQAIMKPGVVLTLRAHR